VSISGGLRSAGLPALDQIRIGEERPPDRDQIGLAGIEIAFRPRGVIAAGKDEPAFELFAEGVFDRLRHRRRAYRRVIDQMDVEEAGRIERTRQIRVILFHFRIERTRGGLAGGTIGYNYQLGQWLVGAEAWSNIRGTFNRTAGAAAFSLSSQLNWLDTTRVRVGWVWDHALFYGTAGAAVGGVTTTASASAAIGGLGAAARAADTQTRFGWTAGSGVEYAFNNYLSAKVEYMYVNLGTQTQINVDSVKFNTNIVRAGVNLHF
jgi:opacity protein-like surface antigen